MGCGVIWVVQKSKPEQKLRTETKTKETHTHTHSLGILVASVTGHNSTAHIAGAEQAIASGFMKITPWFPYSD